MRMDLQRHPVQAPRTETAVAYYETVAFDTLRALWRHRILIAAFVAAGLLLATLALAFVERRYTAEAVIHLDFAQIDPARAKGPPSATMDASVLVESEARLIRSPSMARKVVARLKLNQDPAFTSQGFMARLTGFLRPATSGAPIPVTTDLAQARVINGGGGQ